MGLRAERVNRSRGILKALLKQSEDAALGQTHSGWGGQRRGSLRWVLVHMADRSVRAPLQTGFGPDTSVSAVAFSPDGKLLVTGAGDGTLRGGIRPPASPSARPSRPAP